jgi:hypothetical protein
MVKSKIMTEGMNVLQVVYPIPAIQEVSNSTFTLNFLKAIPTVGL